MPNWVDHEFAVIGPQADVNRFCELAVTGTFRSDVALEEEPTFRFAHVCPIRPRDRKTCQDEHSTGVLLRFVRTRIQAHFSLITAWDIPRHFYFQRMLRDWPRLAFCCAVNEDMESFGGVVAGFDGLAIDAVQDYETAEYDRKAHARQVRAVVSRWNQLIHAERPWRVVLPWRNRRKVCYQADATFDDQARCFAFRTEHECRHFARRYQGAEAQQRVGRVWKALVDRKPPKRRSAGQRGDS